MKSNALEKQTANNGGRGNRELRGRIAQRDVSAAFARRRELTDQRLKRTFPERHRQTTRGTKQKNSGGILYEFNTD